jgi:hypothetical protein
VPALVDLLEQRSGGEQPRLVRLGGGKGVRFQYPSSCGGV